jgi:hypothetical protein
MGKYFPSAAEETVCVPRPFPVMQTITNNNLLKNNTYLFWHGIRNT